MHAHIVRYSVAGAVVLFAAIELSAPTGAQGARLQPAPPLVTSTWANLVGVWIADNSAFKSTDEPIDAYGLEWTWGVGRQSLVGRLYGTRDGKEIATFWDFREFWHPGEAKVFVAQFGVGGAYGFGPNEYRADGTSEMLQMFYDAASGATTRSGHRSDLKGDIHVTRSFDVTAAGVWQARRVYTWKRQR